MQPIERQSLIRPLFVSLSRTLPSSYAARTGAGLIENNPIDTYARAAVDLLLPASCCDILCIESFICV